MAAGKNEIHQAWQGLTCLLLGCMLLQVNAQGNSAGVKKGVTLIETRTDDHSGTNEPPRDKRFFSFSGFQQTVPFEALHNYNQQLDQFGGRTGSRNFAQQTVPFDALHKYNQIQDQVGGRTGSRNFAQQTVPFDALHRYNQQQDQFGGRTGSRNYAPDVIDTFTNTGYFNSFNQMMSSPQFGNFDGRTGNRPMNNMWPWGYGDWSSQWGWPSYDGFWGRSSGGWGQQSQWGGQWGGQASNSGQWNQFGGRSVSGPWSQFGGRSRGNWPSNSYGYGYPYGIRK